MAQKTLTLDPSKLNDQKELMADDVEIEKLRLFIHGHESAFIQQRITDAELERTMEGASTLTLTVYDPVMELQNSGLITTKTDCYVDGLFFRLASCERMDESLRLTFEDREVALLRDHDGFRKANRDSMTRAEFAHELVKEVKEVHIRFFSPEEHKTQPVAPDPTDQTGIDYSRGGGFAPGADITVKGVPATTKQIKNTDTVLQVGRSMGVPTVALEAAVETINVESSALNLSGGDRDSVGIFQQRNIAPWNKRNRRDVAQASRTFFEQALRYLDIARHRNEHVTSWGLAQAVQISAFPERYKQWRTEAEHTVALWGGDLSGNNQGSGASGNIFLDSSGGAGTYEFTRGTIDEQGRITKETSWDCLNRLAQEVNWRCFMVSGTVYFISEQYLFRSRPRMTIKPDSQGIDWLDFDYDRNKANAKVTVTCRISRWGAPPGSVVMIDGYGPIDGRWLVDDITRSLFSSQATIDLIKPLPKLPEPPAQQGDTGTPDSAIIGPTSDQRQAIVRAAQKALRNKADYRYRQYRPMASSLFDAFAFDHTDCSAFVTLCYKAGGAPDPNGFGYNGSGYTGTLWAKGTLVQESEALPGDLVFYGSRVGHRSRGAFTRHVALYIGGGQTIEFGSTPISKGTVHEASDFIGIRSYFSDNTSGR